MIKQGDAFWYCEGGKAVEAKAVAATDVDVAYVSKDGIQVLCQQRAHATRRQALLEQARLAWHAMNQALVSIQEAMKGVLEE